MAITVGLAPVVAALLGLFAVGTVDFLGEGGNARPLAWATFVLTLLIVSRDALFQGSFRARLRDRIPGVRVREGQVRLMIFDFEPVATTLAIIMGLMASGAANFQDGNGGGSAWAWTALALALFLTIGGRLNRRPRPSRCRNQPDVEAEDRAARFFEEMTRGFFEVRRRRRR